MLTRLRPAVVLGLVCLGLALPARAGSEEPEGWAYALWHEMMSPFCPGRSLADCPSTAAESLRMWILMQEAGGRERSEVEAELRRQTRASQPRVQAAEPLDPDLARRVDEELRRSGVRPDSSP